MTLREICQNPRASIRVRFCPLGVLVFSQHKFICNMSASKRHLATRAETARLLGVHRSTIGRYVMNHPNVEKSGDLIDVGLLAALIDQDKSKERRGCKLGARRLLKTGAPSVEVVKSFAKRVDAIREQIDLLSDDEQSALRGMVMDFFRPEIPSGLPVGMKAKARVGRSMDYPRERDRLMEIAVDLSRLPDFDGYASGAEARAVEKAARGEMLTNEETSLVRKLSRLLLHRDLD
jgi:hypothetical protein